MAFDPDAYLQKKSSGSFNPDEYLKKKLEPQQAEPSFWETAEASVKSLPGIAKEELRGVVNKVSFGTLAKQTPEQEMLDQSIFTPDPNAEGGLRPKTFWEEHPPYKLGQYVGEIIPFIASELALGKKAGELALKYGLGPVKAAMAREGMSMAAVEGTKGAVEGRDPIETTRDMAIASGGGGALGAVGYGASKGADWMLKDAPEGIMNQYMRTPAKMADDLKRSRKDSLGRQVLDKTDVGFGDTKSKIYDDFAGELEQNNMLLESKLEKYSPTTQVPMAPSATTGPLGEAVRVGGQAQATLKQGPVIDLDAIRQRLPALIQEQKNIGKPEMAAVLQELQNGIAPGEKYVTVKRGYEILRDLNSEINKQYLNETNQLAPGTEGRKVFADALRGMISEKAPEVSGLLARQHFLMNAQTALLPQVSGRAPIGGSADTIRTVGNLALGNTAGLGLARVLNSPITEEAVKGVAAPVVNMGGRIGLSETINSLRQRKKEEKKK